jgi:hypothetical protein
MTFRSIPLYRVDRFVGRNHTGMRADEQLQLGIYLCLSVSICQKDDQPVDPVQSRDQRLVKGET